MVDEVKDEVDEAVDEDPAFVEGRERGVALRQAPQQQQKGRDEVEEKAMKVPEAAVKRYWRDREAERKAPRGTSAYFPSIFTVIRFRLELRFLVCTYSFYFCSNLPGTVMMCCCIPTFPVLTVQ